MPFSNVWDTTFPPDTQLANLLGQDIRQGVKVDVQQRMAAISGLDAAKPNFAGDAQPANWNGILFFATDTGSIYQFNNPSWTNLTANFTTRSNALKAVNQVVNTGNTTLNTIYTLTLPAGLLGTVGRVRITLSFELSSYSSGDIITINFGATSFGPGTLSFSRLVTGVPNKVVIEGGNTGATNAQLWDGLMFGGNGGANGSVQPFMNFQTPGTEDTTAPVSITVKAQNGVAGDTQVFDFLTVEFF